jgi:hypothetical protein
MNHLKRSPDRLTEDRGQPLRPMPCPDKGTARSVGDRAGSFTSSPESSPEADASDDSNERDYVHAILDCYLWLPGTATVTSRLDQRCARALFQRGVPRSVVEAAMIVAVARRTFRASDPLPRVRALHFFLPVVEEMLEVPCDPAYVGYLKQKLQALAAQKRHLSP